MLGIYQKGRIRVGKAPLGFVFFFFRNKGDAMIQGSFPPDFVPFLMISLKLKLQTIRIMLNPGFEA